jgi:hypothetical protein
LLLEPLQQIAKPGEKYFFIIDAVDEADSEGTNEIVQFISSRFLDLPSWMNIILTGRPEPEPLKKLKKFNPIELRVDDERNKNDLELFLNKRENILDRELIEALIQKSEGNILYLKSIFELEMIKYGEITRESIEQLPSNIEDFYLTNFERKFPDAKQYEKNYLAFISLLVMQRGMPKLLLKDILKLSEREYNKIKSSFGSLFKVDNGILTFYHKTIYEWLSDYEKSGDYSADLEMGKKTFEEFIDSLSSDTYKEEYLEFEFFNKNIIEKVYEEKGSLDDYFELLRGVLNNKKKIETLIVLGHYYHLHNKMPISIELLEKTLEIVK